MASSAFNPWLHRFAVGTAAATLFLIWVGGLVTSHGAGMAVPDWPTTYGYNMFFFPVSQWAGGIFYEHSHRLVASGVGLLTVILAVWLWLKEDRLWLRWLGGAALALVLIQGLLGGLRVVWMRDALGVFHATLAQLFLLLLCAIALFTSRWWVNADVRKFAIYDGRRLRYVIALVTGLILVQLMLGAAMRHQHAGLAIPDFPLAYGTLWPATDANSIARYNQMRQEVSAQNSITSNQVVLQMAHRLTALVILFVVAWASGTALRRAGWRSPIGKFGAVWLALILAQVVLGASVIWTQKAADIATLHVAVGALSLVTGGLLALMLSRTLRAGEPMVSAASLPTAEVRVNHRQASVSA